MFQLLTFLLLLSMAVDKINGQVECFITPNHHDDDLDADESALTTEICDCCGKKVLKTYKYIRDADGNITGETLTKVTDKL